MAEDSDDRGWDELYPDVLGLIFKKLPLEEVLTVVRRVCKSWNRVGKGPYCWQEIEIEEWSQDRQAETIDRLLQMLITRSGGSLRKLCVSCLSGDSSFSLIANNGTSLKTLKLPRSQMTDSIMDHLGMFLNLKFLDLSFCMKIEAAALEAIGKHCNFLVGLWRVLRPMDVTSYLVQDDEAIAIATSMPKLKTLEISYLAVGTASVTQIITKCRDLGHLDICGCFHVNLDRDFLQKFPKINLVGPDFVDPFDISSSDYYCSSETSDSSGYLTWHADIDDLDDAFDVFLDGSLEDHIQEIEAWFYYNLMGDEHWQQSP